MNAAYGALQPGIYNGLSPQAPLFRYADGTFVRASPATWWNGLLLTRYLDNELRQPVLINGRKAFAFEGERTNLATDSSELDTVANGTRTANSGTGPGGVVSVADLIEATAASSSRLRRLVTEATIPDNVSAAVSVFCQRVGSWESPFPSVQFRNKAGTYTAGPAFSDRGGWQRLSRVLDTSAGAVNPSVGIFQAATSADWDALAWGVQLEANVEFASSLIETAGAADTREPDDLVVTDGWTTLFAQTKFQFWFSPRWEGLQLFAGPGFTGLMARAGGEYIFIQANAAGALRTRLRDASANQATTSYIAMAKDDVFRVEVTPSIGKIELFNETQSLSASATNGAISMGAGNAAIGNLTVPGTSDLYGLMTEPYAA